MTRPIKFRIRIQNLKTNKITTDYQTLEQLETGVVFDWCFDKENESEIRKILSRDQFTGLTDKNGKEIYEGDVVRIEGLDCDCNVIFSNIHSRYQFDDVPFDDINIRRDVKVIGNVYKDLLTTTDTDDN